MSNFEVRVYKNCNRFYKIYCEGTYITTSADLNDVRRIVKHLEQFGKKGELIDLDEKATKDVYVYRDGSEGFDDYPHSK